MKNFSLLVVLFILFHFVSFGQKVFENQVSGFSIEEPTNWHTLDNLEINKNLENYTFSPADFGVMIDNHNSSLSIVAFYKYNPRKYAGIIPTLYIVARKNNSKNFEDFMRKIKNMTEKEVKSFIDYKVIGEVRAITVDGNQAVTYLASYSLKRDNGSLYKIIEKSIFIPKGNLVYSVNFVEELDKEDNMGFVDKLIKTIKIKL